MQDSYTLEIIAFTLESCRVIENCGINRIELCANPPEGGTTPSYGVIKAAREAVAIDLFPIIRPRGGDFLYNDEEYTAMVSDVRMCKELGCNGVVLGLLNSDGSVDVKRVAHLVSAAYPMEVTFHRAFDHCRNPFEALEQLVQVGCQRILTSGQQPTAVEGAQMLAQLVQAAAHRIVIMPGSGVRPDNIKALAQKTGAREFHASLRSLAQSRMEFMHPAFSQQEGYSFATVEANDIKALKTALLNE